MYREKSVFINLANQALPYCSSAHFSDLISLSLSSFLPPSFSFFSLPLPSSLPTLLAQYYPLTSYPWMLAEPWSICLFFHQTLVCADPLLRAAIHLLTLPIKSPRSFKTQPGLCFTRKLLIPQWLVIPSVCLFITVVIAYVSVFLFVSPTPFPILWASWGRALRLLYHLTQLPRTMCSWSHSRYINIC